MRQQQRARPPSPPGPPSTEQREVTTRVQLSPRYKHSPKYVITNGWRGRRPRLSAGDRRGRARSRRVGRVYTRRRRRRGAPPDMCGAPPPRGPREQRTHTSQLTRTHQLRSKIYSTIMVRAPPSGGRVVGRRPEAKRTGGRSNDNRAWHALERQSGKSPAPSGRPLSVSLLLSLLWCGRPPRSGWEPPGAGTTGQTPETLVPFGRNVAAGLHARPLGADVCVVCVCVCECHHDW